MKKEVPKKASESHGSKQKYLAVKNACRTMILPSEFSLDVVLVPTQQVKRQVGQHDYIICVYSSSGRNIFSQIAS